MTDIHNPLEFKTIIGETRLEAVIETTNAFTKQLVIQNTLLQRIASGLETLNSKTDSSSQFFKDREGLQKLLQDILDETEQEIKNHGITVGDKVIQELNDTAKEEKKLLYTDIKTDISKLGQDIIDKTVFRITIAFLTSSAIFGFIVFLVNLFMKKP